MIKNTPRFTIQHPVMDDLERVHAFSLACDIAEYGEPDSDIDDLSDAWKESDLSSDAWLALDPAGEINGYTLLTRDSASKCTLDFYTNPETCPDGLPETLLDLGIERFKNLISTGEIELGGRLTLYSNGKNAGMCALIESRAFQSVMFHYRMQIDFGESYAAPAWPEGFVLSQFSESDEEDLYGLITEAFDWPGHEMPPFETWKKFIFRGGRFDPELFILVRMEGKLVGAAITYDEETRGWLKQLAVSKSMQGKGLGSLLLKQVFNLYSRKGIPTVALGVASTNRKACEFYERSGMYRSREFVQYEWH